MMKSKFEFNELVILQSQSQPECNGEYCVKEIKYGEFYHPSKQILVESFVYDLGVEHDAGRWWFEEALRKRHQKGDMSFKELVKDLKTNIQERA